MKPRKVEKTGSFLFRCTKSDTPFYLGDSGAEVRPQQATSESHFVMHAAIANNLKDRFIVPVNNTVSHKETGKPINAAFLAYPDYFNLRPSAQRHPTHSVGK